MPIVPSQEQIMKKILALVLFLLASFSANAVTELNRAFTSVGVQGPLVYVVLNPAPTSCLYGLVYIWDLSTAQGKAMLVTLLTAQVRQVPLQRIDYAQDTSGICIVSLIQI